MLNDSSMYMYVDIVLAASHTFPNPLFMCGAHTQVCFRKQGSDVKQVNHFDAVGTL